MRYSFATVLALVMLLKSSILLPPAKAEALENDQGVTIQHIYLRKACCILSGLSVFNKPILCP